VISSGALQMMPDILYFQGPGKNSVCDSCILSSSPLSNQVQFGNPTIIDAIMGRTKMIMQRSTIGLIAAASRKLVRAVVTLRIAIVKTGKQ